MIESFYAQIVDDYEFKKTLFLYKNCFEVSKKLFNEIKCNKNINK